MKFPLEIMRHVLAVGVLEITVTQCARRVLFASLANTNGHCPPPGRWIMKQWPAGINSRFAVAEVTENDILRMQDITIPNDTKKPTKLGIKVFRDKQCFNTQFAHMSRVFCPDR